MSLSAPILIETCLELGPFTEAQVAEKLTATANHPHIKAILSWIEYKIGSEHALLTTRGLGDLGRAEAAGAADALKTLRTDLIKFTQAGLHDQTEPS